jgi:methionyl-tRNA formyltransferase
MRLAFMGSPEFAVPALRALHAAGHEIAVVYCQPARPAGRGHAVRRCPVHAEADLLRLAVRTPARLRTASEEWQAFKALDLDAAVVAAYGLILPKPMLVAPGRGCLNIHASLLPRWRGAAPMQAAILAGNAETGITIMQMDEGLDTGPMLLRETVPITPSTTTAILHDVLAQMGARLILKALTPPLLTPVPQLAEGATYAPKLSREDGRIDWSLDPASIERQVRAFDPWPGTFTTLNGTVLKILSVVIAEGQGAEVQGAEGQDAERSGTQPGFPGVSNGVAGTVLDHELRVACGGGALRLTRVQLAGRSAMDAAAFLRGHSIAPGERLGT